MKVLWFTAAWCGPCKKMKPVMDSIQKEHDDLVLEVYDIDSPEGRAKAAEWNVTGVPTFLAMDPAGGEASALLIGAHPKGKVLKALGIS